jgi:hypothetical protein
MQARYCFSVVREADEWKLLQEGDAVPLPRADSEAEIVRIAKAPARQFGARLVVCPDHRPLEGKPDLSVAAAS